ncbi:hypothetical protein [Nostoc sp. NZL]|uniref:hypothetical protein n=1 Tax=Nostoc sp. NZL TaxID=2650612 RepID=UPI0018C66CB7|nr:hypothetical protein [Nostoc sp. NZL]
MNGLLHRFDDENEQQFGVAYWGNDGRYTKDEVWQTVVIHNLFKHPLRLRSL